jgi:hypothetical protein
MKGGRLKIVNESSYPDDEVEALVRYGLSEIDLTGDGLVAVVKHTKRSRRRSVGRAAYSGTAYSLAWGIPTTLYERYIGRRKARHLIIMRVGTPDCFPVSAFRHYAGVKKDEFRTWQEALVCITAHEGMHIQHAHDGVYGDTQKSGRRTLVWRNSWGQEIGKKIVKVRVGSERIEPKCEAFEAYMLRRYRHASSVLKITSPSV